MTANPQRIPETSIYPDGTGWRVRVDMPEEVIADLNLRSFVDGEGTTRQEAVDDVRAKLFNAALHLLQHLNSLTKAS